MGIQTSENSGYRPNRQEIPGSGSNPKKNPEMEQTVKRKLDPEQTLRKNPDMDPIVKRNLDPDLCNYI